MLMVQKPFYPSEASIKCNTPAVIQSHAYSFSRSLMHTLKMGASKSNLPNLHHLLDRLPTNRAVMVLHLPSTLLTRT